MADKRSFIVYYDIKETLDELTDEQVGSLFRAMVEYELTGAEPAFTGVMKLAWIPIRQGLTRDGSKYDELIQKRKKAGSMGGKARAENARKDGQANTQAKPLKNRHFSKQTSSKRQANQASQADNDNDNVNVNVNVNDNDNVYVNDNEGASHLDSDDTHTDSDFGNYGTLHNVRLTRNQYQEILATYQNARKLINKVSTWLPEAAHPVSDHFALVHRFAVNDDWPKKPDSEPPPNVIELDPTRGPVEPMPEKIKEKYAEVFG